MFQVGHVYFKIKVRQIAKTLASVSSLVLVFHAANGRSPDQTPRSRSAILVPFRGKPGIDVRFRLAYTCS